jgi:hypothetical protein
MWFESVCWSLFSHDIDEALDESRRLLGRALDG